MKFYGTEVHGLMPALIGMRLPMSKNYEDAKSKVDSIIFRDTCIIGEKDMRVAKNLEKADEKKGGGTPNSKFLQMIEIWVCIEAPLTFWSEFDTYRHMVKNSTSKMHKLHSYPIDEGCFEVNPFTNKVSESVDINKLEKLRQKYNETKNKKDWYELLDNIPSSWLQSRMCHFNYQTLKDMVIWRSEHKLNCWSGKDNPELDNFIAWAKTLPYAEELIFIGDKKMKIIKNSDVNRYNVISKAVELNGGYCPCLIFKNQDTKCPCKEFREQNKVGLCRCGRYMKVEE